MLIRRFVVIAVLSVGAIASCQSARDGAPETATLGADATLPRLDGSTPQDRRINAELARLDAATEASIEDCLRANSEINTWLRKVTVTLNGPRFLSLRIWDALGCGSPTQYGFEARLNYDRATGEPIDWVDLAPAAVINPIVIEPVDVSVVDPRLAAPESKSASPVLWRWFYGRVRAVHGRDPEWLRDCSGLYDPERGSPLSLWLDGEKGGLVASVTNLGRLDAQLACAVEIVMPPAEMRRFGFDPVLVEAVSGDGLHAPQASEDRVAGTAQ